jgi:hypothetical protein
MFIQGQALLLISTAGGIFHDPGKFRLVPDSVQLILCSLALFDNPEDFIPERYLLSENGTKPGVDGSGLRPTFSFGFGRVSFPLLSLRLS